MVAGGIDLWSAVFALAGWPRRCGPPDACRDSRLHDRRRAGASTHPFRVGPAATNGPSGARPDTGCAGHGVINTNDKLSLSCRSSTSRTTDGAVYKANRGHLPSVGRWWSYDSNDPAARSSAIDTYQLVNAFFSLGANLIAWDRGVHG